MLSPDQAAILGTLGGIAFTLMAWAMQYGIMRGRFDELMKNQEKMREEIDEFPKEYVPYRHFQESNKHVEQALGRIEANVSKLTDVIISGLNSTHSRKGKGE